MPESLIDIRSKLSRTNNVFFSNFSQLTDIQKKVIPLILEDKNCLIISPTASGKTEAVIAPICEKLISRYELRTSKPKLFVLCVFPTRALVNDMYKRLEHPLSRLNISISTKTSDQNNFNIKSPQNFLLTTPESLDSLLMRNSDVFKTLEYIILDELHFIDNEYRGDQIRVLLQRIRNRVENPNNLKTYVMSATITKPEIFANRYMDNFEIIISKGSRKIIFEPIHSGIQYNNLKEIHQIFLKKRIHKAIFFCNKRADVIILTKKLQEVFRTTDGIFEHHGKLSKNERKRVEDAMARTNNILSICVATSTLEVGIDIGNIDATFLVHPPLTVSSLMQRIGRGNRRTNTTICFGLYKNDEDMNIFQEMINKAKTEEIEEAEYAADLSVCVQQILSLSIEMQNVSGDKLSRKKIYQFLKPLEEDVKVLDLIINKLINDNFIMEKIGGIIEPNTQLLDHMEKSPMSVNTNIPFSRELAIVTTSGKKLGDVTGTYSKLSKIQFASATYRVLGMQNNKVIVEKYQKGNGSVPSMARYCTYGRWYNYLPDELK